MRNTQARDGARSIDAQREIRNGAVAAVERGGVWGWWASANVAKQDLALDFLEWTRTVASELEHSYLSDVAKQHLTPDSPNCPALCPPTRSSQIIGKGPSQRLLSRAVFQRLSRD